MASSNTTEVDPFDHNRQALPGCNGDEPQWIDPTRVEAFEYGDLAGATKQLERKFDDLTGISPLWLSVDGDEPGVPNFSGKGRRGGRAMFGDWQLDDSLVEAFENQTDATQHDKQGILKVVDALLAMCDENGANERQRLEECALAFKKATEGNLNKHLDELTEQATRRWREEQKKAEEAQIGLLELDATVASRLEHMAQGLKDRQDTVLTEMKREREADRRKILASTLGDAHEDGRMLFNKQLEEVELEGRLKQRRRLLDVSSNGVQHEQKDIEEAMLKAARDRVQNLMQVVEKMQTQQTTLSITLQGEKRKVTAIRLDISKRLGVSMQQTKAMLRVDESNAASAKAEKVTAKANPTDKVATKTPETDTASTGSADSGGAANGEPPGNNAGDAGQMDSGEACQPVSGRADEDNDEDVGPNTLKGVELLEACDRLEHDNVRLRQQLAKLELRALQKEHDDEEQNDHEDLRVAKVVDTKKKLEERLQAIQRANEERSMELKRLRAGKETKNRQTSERTGARTDKSDDKLHKRARKEERKSDGEGEKAMNHQQHDIEAEEKLLARKITCLRRQRVFGLALKVMKRRFDEAGLGPGNDPTPPPGPMAAIKGAAQASSSVPLEMQLNAALYQQRLAIEIEIDRTVREEQELVQAVGESVADRSRGGDEGPKAEEGVDAKSGRTEQASEAGGEAATGDDSIRVRSLKRKQRAALNKLAALRAIAARTQEIEDASPSLDQVDSEALKAVLRQEEIVNEKAVAVLDILRSPEMKQASARWLKVAIERSLNVDTEAKDVSHQPSDDTRATVPLVAASTTAAASSKISEHRAPKGGAQRPSFPPGEPRTVEYRSSGDDGRAVVTSSNREGIRPVNDKPTHDIAAAGEKPPESDTTTPSRTGFNEKKTAVELADGSGKGQEAGGSGRSVLLLTQDEQDTSDAEAAAASASLSVAAVAEVARKNEEEHQAREKEREACVELVKMRAAKQEIIKDLRAKIAALGGGQPRTSSKELRKREIKQEIEKTQVAKKKIAAARSMQDPSLKQLPMKERREISNLRKMEASLISGYNVCLLRMRKLLLSRGITSEIDLVDREDAADVDAQDHQPPKPRKLTKTELEREKSLHSLTPQLVRWRARIAAATQVLEEALTQRATAELAAENAESGNAGSINSTPRTQTAGTGSDSPFAGTLPLLPVARVNLDVNAFCPPGSGSAESPNSGRKPSVESAWKRCSPADRGGTRGQSTGAMAEAAATTLAIAAERAGGYGAPSVGRVSKDQLYPIPGFHQETRSLRFRSEKPQRWMKQQTTRTGVDNTVVRSPASPIVADTSSRSAIPASPMVPSPRFTNAQSATIKQQTARTGVSHILARSLAYPIGADADWRPAIPASPMVPSPRFGNVQYATSKQQAARTGVDYTVARSPASPIAADADWRPVIPASPTAPSPRFAKAQSTTVKQQTVRTGVGYTVARSPASPIDADEDWRPVIPVSPTVSSPRFANAQPATIEQQTMRKGVDNTTARSLTSPIVAEASSTRTIPASRMAPSPRFANAQPTTIEQQTTRPGVGNTAARSLTSPIVANVSSTPSVPAARMAPLPQLANAQPTVRYLEQRPPQDQSLAPNSPGKKLPLDFVETPSQQKSPRRSLQPPPHPQPMEDSLVPARAGRNLRVFEGVARGQPSPPPSSTSMAREVPFPADANGGVIDGLNLYQYPSGTRLSPPSKPVSPQALGQPKAITDGVVNGVVTEVLPSPNSPFREAIETRMSPPSMLVSPVSPQSLSNRKPVADGESNGGVVTILAPSASSHVRGVRPGSSRSDHIVRVDTASPLAENDAEKLRQETTSRHQHSPPLESQAPVPPGAHLLVLGESMTIPTPPLSPPGRGLTPSLIYEGVIDRAYGERGRGSPQNTTYSGDPRKARERMAERSPPRSRTGVDVIRRVEVRKGGDLMDSLCTPISFVSTAQRNVGVKSRGSTPQSWSVLSTRDGFRGVKARLTRTTAHREEPGMFSKQTPKTKQPAEARPWFAAPPSALCGSMLNELPIFETPSLRSFLAQAGAELGTTSSASNTAKIDQQCVTISSSLKTLSTSSSTGGGSLGSSTASLVQSIPMLHALSTSQMVEAPPPPSKNTAGGEEARLAPRQGEAAPLSERCHETGSAATASAAPAPKAQSTTILTPFRPMKPSGQRRRLTVAPIPDDETLLQMVGARVRDKGREINGGRTRTEGRRILPEGRARGRRAGGSQMAMSQQLPRPGVAIAPALVGLLTAAESHGDTERNTTSNNPQGEGRYSNKTHKRAPDDDEHLRGWTCSAASEPPQSIVGSPLPSAWTPTTADLQPVSVAGCERELVDGDGAKHDRS